MTGKLHGVEEFARRDRAALIGYVLKLGASYQDAEDIAAETIRRMVQQWAVIDAPRAWARKTALRLAIDATRKRRTDRNPPFPHRRAMPAEPSADELYVLKEEQRAVIGHIRSLPPRQRSVLALHLDGFTNPEIADVLGVNPVTVASHLRHAKHRLRRVLEADGLYRPVPAPDESAGSE